MQNSALISGSTYHVFNKSISGYEIFSSELEFMRMQQVFNFYKTERSGVKFSQFCSNSLSGNNKSVESETKEILQNVYLVEIIAYCIMPTHIHLILRQLKDDGIFNFIRNSSISYTKYFNLKHNRKGPLWEARFKRVEVTSDEQLIHLTRYVHLNPVTAYLTNHPGEWFFSSYNEYTSNSVKDRICNFGSILKIVPSLYREFVVDHIDYQRNLARIKNMIFDRDSTS